MSGASTHDPAAVLRPDFQPLYARIQVLITRRIGDGLWKPGDLLPTEMELAAEYGVSQGTVRKALIALEGERLIVRRQGVGTYVARHARDSVLFRFFRMVDPAGTRISPRSRVLRQSIRAATVGQAARLGLAPGARLHAVTRLRLLGDAPAIHEDIYAPVSLIPSLPLPRDREMNEEMYVIYQERFHVFVARVEETLRAVAAGRRESAALGIPLGLPLIEISRVAFDVNNRPVELRISRCDTHRYRYATDFADTGGA